MLSVAPKFTAFVAAAQARKSMVGAEVQRGLLGGGCGDGASYTPVKAAPSEETSVESTGLSFSSFWDWHSLSNKVRSHLDSVFDLFSLRRTLILNAALMAAQRGLAAGTGAATTLDAVLLCQPAYLHPFNDRVPGGT
jgi:hypothetical protein